MGYRAVRDGRVLVDSVSALSGYPFAFRVGDRSDSLHFWKRNTKSLTYTTTVTKNDNDKNGVSVVTIG